jgi:gp16 family phage-associated protein
MFANARTHAEAQQWFVDKGIAVSDWAISQGFTPALVYAVLHGRRKCLRGQSHRIAVALGLQVPSPRVSRGRMFNPDQRSPACHPDFSGWEWHNALNRWRGIRAFRKCQAKLDA